MRKFLSVVLILILGIPAVSAVAGPMEDVSSGQTSGSVVSADQDQAPAVLPPLVQGSSSFIDLDSESPLSLVSDNEGAGLVVTQDNLSQFEVEPGVYVIESSGYIVIDPSVQISGSQITISVSEPVNSTGTITVAGNNTSNINGALLLQPGNALIVSPVNSNPPSGASIQVSGTLAVTSPEPAAVTPPVNVETEKKSKKSAKDSGYSVKGNKVVKEKKKKN